MKNFTIFYKTLSLSILYKFVRKKYKVYMLRVFLSTLFRMKMIVWCF